MSTAQEFDLKKRFSRRQLEAFAAYLNQISRRVGFKMSSRGWCYALEQNGLIDKSQFDRVENAVNRCRRDGLVPIDFVAEEDARRFSGVEKPTESSPGALFRRNLQDLEHLEDFYTPRWWDGEIYYLQCIVEKIDLKTLFEETCREFHIPIATSKGWSSMLQRAEYARRFAEAEEAGLECVLLYCGDHDPDGLRISDTLRSNLEDLAGVFWTDGASGYDPSGLRIDRFGLNRDFIDEHRLSWIDNLVTGSGKNLASPSHPNNRLPYVQAYLGDHGARKCEANALVVNPEAGRDLMPEAIERWLGSDAQERFEARREDFARPFERFRVDTGLDTAIAEALEACDKGEY